MRLINNLKTRTKLLLSFTVIIVITVMVGINGLLTASSLQGSFLDFYNDHFVTNMLLSEIQLNQEKVTTEIQRVLYKTQALQDPTVVDESVQALNELIADNDRLLQEYEATDLTPEEKEILTALKLANNNYRSAREELLAAAKSGNYELAVEINE